MAYKETTTMEIKEIIRRRKSGQTISEISKSVGRDRKTVRKYLNLLEEKGVHLSEIDINSEKVIGVLVKITEQMRRTTEKQDVFFRFLEEIKALVEDRSNQLKLKSVFRVICSRYDLENKVSYSSFLRFVKAHQLTDKQHNISCRIEMPPGHQLQVDYAKVGFLRDRETGKRKTVYAFIGTLSHSRHKFVEFVYKQDQKSFVESHVKMFKFFGGVPKTVVIDNLKAGVIKPDLYNPGFNRSYSEMAEYYNCFIDPARVAKPKDKPKVERDVQTIREEFKVMLSLNETLSIADTNRKILDFLINDYGKRKHGTTGEKPMEVFEEIEKKELMDLPKDEFEVCQWKQAKVHPDCYIQINKKSYSLPYEFVGKTVLIKVKSKIIEVYYDEVILKVHTIPKGKRQTDYSDFPENIRKSVHEKLPYYLQKEAEKLGGANLREVIRKLLTPHAFINLRRAQGIISIAKKYSNTMNEKAASEALLRQRSPHPKDFKKLIETIKNQEESVTEGIAISDETKALTRNIEYFIHN